MKQSPKPRVLLIQPAVPSYRKPFFSSIADSLGDRFTVHSSNQDMGVLTYNSQIDSWLQPTGPIKQLFPGAEWQLGSMEIPIASGDIVVISGAPRCLSNITLLLRARMCGAKTIWWGQLWSASSRWYRFMIRLALMRLAHAILFYTDREVESYKIQFSRDEHRPLSALNNGIDVKPIKLLRKPYSPETRNESILFVGRLTEKSQLTLLLQAMQHQKLAKATLHVIGDGPDISKLQGSAHAKSLGMRVVWHGGTVDETVISRIMNQAALFCYPGSVGLSLLHAMAYGLPAVVHDDPKTHMPEIAAFESGVTGLSFAKDKSDDLAEKLAALLNDPSLRIIMSEASVARTEKIYNTDIMATRFISFINEVSKIK